MKRDIIFIKLGGSLITNKRKRETPRQKIIKSIAQEIRNFLNTPSNLDLLIGHGSGSFGHWEAQKYGTRYGVSTKQQWEGFARVSAAAAQLNRLVVDTFIEVGVPVVSLQPSASIDTQSGVIVNYDISNIQKCFSHQLIPLIYGDVAFDQIRGGTILSTEDLFAYLTPLLKPTRIILLGIAPGVFSNQGELIRRITSLNYSEIKQHLHGSKYTDVTGGMADKVKSMVELVDANNELQVHILSGVKTDFLGKLLRDAAFCLGTVITKS